MNSRNIPYRITYILALFLMFLAAVFYRQSLLTVLLLLLLILPVCVSADLMNVGGVLKYYDEHGREAEHIGLDLSYYNNQVDFQALSDQGFDFVLIRLGGRGWGASGRLYGDSKTQTFLRQAHEAGFRVGAYFYSTAVNATEALEEASEADW